MEKNTSISLDLHLREFVSQQVNSGRYGSNSEVVRAGLRLLEEKELKLTALRNAIESGINSGFVEFDMDAINRQVDAECGEE